MSQPQPQEADFGQLAKYYFDLLWRNKWFILVSWPLVTLCAAIAIIAVVNPLPKLRATALIGIENTADMTAVHDVGELVEAQSDLITSRLFLEDIARNLSLRFSPAKYPRSDIFDTVSVDSVTPVGAFSFKLNKDSPSKFYVNFTKDQSGGIPVIRKFTRKPLCVYRGDLSASNVLNLGGMHLVFSKKFTVLPHEFSFEVEDLRKAVEGLYNSVSVKAANPERGLFNIELSVSGKDYSLIAATANAIADAFVVKNASLRKGRSQTVLASLDKQLATVKQDLDAAEQAVRNYRTANPTLGLSDNGKQRLSTLSQQENGALADKRTLADAVDLQAKLSSSPQDEKERVASEALVFLAGKGYSSAPVLQAELSRVAGEQRELERNYSSDHPLVLENRGKLDKLVQDVEASLKSFIGSIRVSVAGRETEIQAMSGELQRLPSNELQLAELMRRQQVASDIYATVLSRYNQAKVAGSAESAAAYVLDYAVAPIAPQQDKTKLLGVALLFGIAVAFGPVLVKDRFDKTARSAYDFRKKTGLPVFEMVPVVPKIERKPDVIIQDLGPIPIVSEYFPNSYAHEVFRMLRTKVMMGLAESEKKILCLTSLESGAGKSTIAANIACVLAQQNASTLLVDADMRCGELHKTFKCKVEPGLSDLLMESYGNAPGKMGSCIQKTSIPHLSLVSVGGAVKNSSELLASQRFADVLGMATSEFAYVIIDVPPLGAVTDACRHSVARVQIPCCRGCGKNERFRYGVKNRGIPFGQRTRVGLHYESVGGKESHNVLQPFEV